MANYTQNDIYFNNVKAGGETTGSSPIWNGQNGVDEFGGIINAIDIDWNSAQLRFAVQSLQSNVQEDIAVSEIKTTGDLLKVIAQLQAQVNTLTTLIKGLYAGLSA